MRSWAIWAAGLELSVTALLVGCARMQTSSCVPYTAFGVYPLTGAADHMAKAPGNQVQFTSSESFAGTGHCAIPALSTSAYPAWTVSDPLNVQVSSAHDATNGLATCVGATAGSVALTGNRGGDGCAVTGECDPELSLGKVFGVFLKDESFSIMFTSYCSGTL